LSLALSDLDCSFAAQKNREKTGRQRAFKFNPKNGIISANVQTEKVKRALLRVGPRAFEKMKNGFRFKIV